MSKTLYLILEKAPGDQAANHHYLMAIGATHIKTYNLYLLPASFKDQIADVAIVKASVAGAGFDKNVKAKIKEVGRIAYH